MAAIGIFGQFRFFPCQCGREEEGGRRGGEEEEG